LISIVIYPYLIFYWIDWRVRSMKWI
jgi:hypothetical protein